MACDDYIVELVTNPIRKPKTRGAVEIGSGSFGRVFSTEDAGRGVAVKVAAGPDSVHEALVSRYVAETYKSQKPLDRLVPALRIDASRKNVAIAYPRGICDLSKLCKFVHTRGVKAPYLRLARDMAVAVAQFHSMGMAHGDVKPSNFIVFPEASSESEAREIHSEAERFFEGGRDVAWMQSITVRLGDYGFASVVCDSLGGSVDCAPSRRYTRQYRPPEVWKSSTWSYASDVWALGMSMIALVTGRNTFHATQDKPEDERAINLLNQMAFCAYFDLRLDAPERDIPDRVSRGMIASVRAKALFSFPRRESFGIPADWSRVDPNLRAVIAECTKFNPDERVSARAACLALGGPCIPEPRRFSIGEPRGREEAVELVASWAARVNGIEASEADVVARAFLRCPAAKTIRASFLRTCEVYPLSSR